MKRHVLSLALLLAATAAIGAKPAPPPPPPIVSALAWYDSTGKLVGPAFANGALARVNEQVIYVSMRAGYGLGDPNAPYGSHVIYACASACNVYFASTDCSGQAYVTRDGGDIAGTTRLSALVHPAMGVITAYLGTASAERGYVIPRSALGGSYPSSTCSILPNPRAMHLVPVEGTLDLSGLWTPPFYLK